MAYFKRRKKGASKAVPLNAEAQRLIQQRRRKFREKFGREPRPEDPLFFDPDAEIPQPISEAQQDESMAQILSAAGRAGIRPELIYAMKKTGRMVTQWNQDLLTDQELQEWQEAIGEYFALIEKQQGA